MELKPPAPRLEMLCHVAVKVAAPQLIGAVLIGERRIIPITGGRFEGLKMRGEQVDPSRDYFRAQPTFETGAPKYAWLNRLLAVCSGVRTKEEALLDFYEVK
jgi:hypothetical protein